MLLDFIDENSWPLDGIIRTEVLETLSEVVPEVILEHFLDWYTTENSQSKIDLNPKQPLFSISRYYCKLKLFF